MSGYFLLCDPSTRTVLRRSHDLPKIYEAGMALAVTKDVWTLYRAGDDLQWRDLGEPSLGRWKRACGEGEAT